MFYAALGIPLCLVVLASLGKTMTRVIKFVWSFVRRFYYTGSFRRVRRMIPLSRVRLSVFQRFRREIRRQTTMRRRDARPETASKRDEVFVPYDVDDKFNLPPIVALVIAFIYIVSGAFMYEQWEKHWNLMDAFYFTFISFCTIGFGDLIPEHPKYFLLTSVYLLIGFALVAMVVNVVMESVNETIDRAMVHVIKATEKVRRAGHQIGHRLIHVSATTSGQCMAVPPPRSVRFRASERRNSV